VPPLDMRTHSCRQKVQSQLDNIVIGQKQGSSGNNADVAAVAAAGAITKTKTR